MNEKPSAPRKRPVEVYFHRPGKNKPQDRFQRQDGPTVRARAKERYRENPKLAKFVSALWREKNLEICREYSRAYWHRHKDKPEFKEAQRLKWIRNRTEANLAAMRAYSKAWRAARKLAAAT